MNPKQAQKDRTIAQTAVRQMVNREVTPVIQARRGPTNAIEEAFVRAIYNPDRRLG